MARAVYPGSFDPITNGHIDVIRRMSLVFPELTVLIAHSPRKQYLFSLEERRRLVEESLRDLKQVKIDVFEGLTADYMKLKNAQVIIRGLRAVADFEFEMAMANTNRDLNRDVETMIVFTSPGVSHISSSLVKEVAFYGGDIKGFVPAVVENAFKAKQKEGVWTKK